jgi:type III pantothenate kinase
MPYGGRNNGMYQLVIDQGNSTSKIAFYQQDKLQTLFRETEISTELLEQLLIQFPIESWVLSSVINNSQWLNDYLSARAPGLQLNWQTDLPIKITYQTPETLGHDRIAAAVGAYRAFPNEAVLIIDAGTCIKYDIVLPDGSFPGGCIAPGLKMRLQAMHTFTDRLPLIDLPMEQLPQHIAITGTSTEGSLVAGAYATALMEANGFIDEYSSQFSNLRVMLTGGDASFFATRLKREIFAVPELNLNGLQAILGHHLKAH